MCGHENYTQLLMSQQALDSIREWTHPFPAAIAPAAKSSENEQFGQSESIAFLRFTPNQLCNSGSEWISPFNRISPLLSKLLFTTSYHVQLIKTQEENSSQTSVLGKPICHWINQTMTKNKPANEKQNKLKQEKSAPVSLKHGESFKWLWFQLHSDEREVQPGAMSNNIGTLFYIFLPRLLETCWKICFDLTYFSLNFPGYH